MEYDIVDHLKVFPVLISVNVSTETCFVLHNQVQVGLSYQEQDVLCIILYLIKSEDPFP